MGKIYCPNSMTIDSTLFYLIIAVSVVHSVLVIILNILYLRSVRSLHALKKEMADESERARLNEAKILEGARHQERDVLTEATHAASKIMGEAKLFNTAVENSFRESLAKATDEYESRFRQSLSEMQTEVDGMIKKTATEMKKPLVTQLDSFTTTFQKELAALRQETRTHIEELQKETLLEVKSYKQQKLKEAEKAIVAMSKDLVRKILGAEISPEKHEELVMKALEEAKRQNIF